MRSLLHRPIARPALARLTLRAAGLWGEEGFLGVQFADWRTAFYAKHTGDTADAKKKAFQRVRRDLVEMVRMTAKDDAYMSTDPAIILGVKLHRDKRDKMKNVPMQKRMLAGQTGQMLKACPVSRPDWALMKSINSYFWRRFPLTGMAVIFLLRRMPPALDAGRKCK